MKSLLAETIFDFFPNKSTQGFKLRIRFESTQKGRWFPHSSVQAKARFLLNSFSLSLTSTCGNNLSLSFFFVNAEKKIMTTIIVFFLFLLPWCVYTFFTALGRYSCFNLLLSTHLSFSLLVGALKIHDDAIGHI